MWPSESSDCAHWRVTHQIQPAKVDRLLNTVMTTDSEATLGWPPRWLGQALELGRLLGIGPKLTRMVLAKAGKWVSRRHSPVTTAAMLGRPSQS